MITVIYHLSPSTLLPTFYVFFLIRNFKGQTSDYKEIYVRGNVNKSYKQKYVQKS